MTTWIFFASFYKDLEGDLKAIAEKYSLSLDLMQQNVPTDAKDFARKLLLGKYTADFSAVAQRDLRRSLTETLKDGARPSLRRTQTRDYEGVVDAGEISMVAKVYNDYKGNLEKLANLFSADKALIYKAYPVDANDFARKLLSGTFTDGTRDDLRSTLKQLLKTELKRGISGLKRTETKEAVIEPDVESVAACAMIFDEHDGDLDKIGNVTGCSVPLLRKHQPADGMIFGRNYLRGLYSA